MGLLVSPNVATLSESSTALLAREGALSGVAAHMSLASG